MMRLGLASSVDLGLGLGDLTIQSRQLGGTFALNFGRLCPAGELTKLNDSPTLIELVVLLEYEGQHCLRLFGDRTGARGQVPSFGQVFAAGLTHRLTVDAQLISACRQTRDL